MYKTKYEAALATAGITYKDLSSKNKAVYDETVTLESNISNLSKTIAKASQEEQESIREDLTTLEQSLELLDADLCKKISKNEFYKQNAVNLAAGRAKAAAGKAAPAKKPAAPAQKPVVAAAAKPEVKAEVKAEVKPEVKAEVKAGAKAETVKAEAGKEVDGKDKKDPVNGKVSTKTILGWTLGAALTGLAAFWGFPISALKKDAFSLKMRR